MSKASFVPFSKKQLTALTWWCPSSPFASYDAILCDGAVRSGKTLCMSISFIAWAFYRFSDTSFAMCGKTVTSLRRNLLSPLLPILSELGFTCQEKVSRNCVVISRGSVTNTFYLFGGRDESSASLIQGITLGGVLLDEVALMPRSFVEQALARCSLDGSKFWFNCNPENPSHWFHREWVLKAKEKNCLYLHFVMEDNPSLTPKIIERYKSLYSGAFYERFVQGKWVAAEGLVYPFFSQSNIASPQNPCSEFYISCDYGTVNPASFGLWGKSGKSWYRIDEYYFDSRKEKYQKTDEEYYAELEKLAGERKIQAVIIDPSAASFIECVRRHGKFRAIPAVNDVADGIRLVSVALKNSEIFISPCCRDSIREFGIYRWDDSLSKDAPKKENDHAMDDIRYFVSTVLAPACDDGFFAVAIDRVS